MAERHFLQCMARFALLLLLAQLTSGDSSQDDFDDELYTVIQSYRDGSLWAKSRQPRSISETPRNESFTDNSLWNDLWFRCRKKPSFSCVKSGVFKYLDKNLDGPDDLRVTDHLWFRKNQNKYYDFCENSVEERDRCHRYNSEKSRVTTEESVNENEISEQGSGDDGTVEGDGKNSTEVREEEDVTEGAADGRSVESLSYLSDLFYDKGTKFFMTHDVELELPQMFFGGGSIRLQPRSFEEENEDGEEGVLMKVVFKPPPPKGEVVRGRFIHHLKKLFKKKLMHSFMALMLIIKMIKVKLMFLLPMIIGQATAKKLLLKTLLFLIPGLAHLFKLCHYYHMEHAKYHHHHHKVKHHHHTVQVPVPVPVPIHHRPEEVHFGASYNTGGYGGHYGVSGPQDYPPHVGYPSGPYPPGSHISSHHDYDYQTSGSAPEGSIYKGEYSQYPDNEAALSSWGLGSQNYQEAGVLDAKDQPAYGYSEPYYKKSPYGQSGYSESPYYQNEVGGQKFYGSKLQYIGQKQALGGGLHRTPDPFYSPILQKIDGIFVKMGYHEEGCRERLVCSMYKNPFRYSPHSNLISNELSRDSRELQKPIMNNEDVLRFYRYVQAARDGQEQKDCIRLYQACHTNTDA